MTRGFPATKALLRTEAVTEDKIIGEVELRQVGEAISKRIVPYGVFSLAILRTAFRPRALAIYHSIKKDSLSKLML